MTEQHGKSSEEPGVAAPEPVLPQGIFAQAQAIAVNADRPSALNMDTKEDSGSETVQPTPNTDEDRSQTFHESGPAPLRNLHLEIPIEQVPPPAYSEAYGHVDLDQDGMDTQARLASDGRVNININQKSRRLSNLLTPALRNQLKVQTSDEPPHSLLGSISPSLSGASGAIPPPPLNIVIHVVGSRGDIQPFVSLGQVLKSTYHHRVRLATHPTFRGFVEENGLEFFSIGGDPAELMAFMVKNPGLMPGMDSLRSGDIGKRRKGMYEIVKGCWRACFEAGDGTGIAASDDHLNNRSSFDSGIAMAEDVASKPFVADAIIANPPSFAHIHCAEKLGIPLHLMFTMPWSPTQSFPHPLANIQASNADPNMTNFLTYALVEMMTWQGLGDVINRFREKSLGLEPVSLMWAPGMASRLRIPYTYCWSPTLIPKPKDWGNHISISGFYFLPLAQNYTPPPDLAAFLDAGPPPIYIGFGSIVVDDANAMTKLIFDAVKSTGQRALVSKGWGGFGGDALSIPEGIFMLGNVPHDWLFQNVSCVVHHGGAGTTAAGIACGKPTVVVPFFGDQPFWGAMVAKAGAGPPPVPYKHLSSDSLAAAIMEALKPSALQRAQELGQKISSEKGSDNGARSFHEKLGMDSLRCSVAPNRTAVWRVKRTQIRLSALAAAVLGNEGLLDFNCLKLYRPREYDSEDGPWDPITGATSALLGTASSLVMGVADIPIEVLKVMQGKSGGGPSSGESSSVSTKSNARAPQPLDQHSPSNPSLKSASDSRNDESLSSLQSPQSYNDSSSSLDFSKDSELHASSGSTAADQPSISRSNSSRNEVANADDGITPDRTTADSPTASMSDKRSGVRTPTHMYRSSIDHGKQISLESAVGAGKGVSRMIGVGLKSPMDFTLGIARGFHNAPRLYGDESVRESEKITGLQSGLKAAGKEFGFGLFDGITGLVTQPIDGAKKEGVVGLLKGFGKGIGGVVLKPSAAVMGLPGYTFKGIYKFLQNQFGSSVQNYIIASRTAQGYEDWKSSTVEERRDIIGRWYTVQEDLVIERKKSHHHRPHSPPGFKKTKHMHFQERKDLAEQKAKGIEAKHTKMVDTPAVHASETVSVNTPEVPVTESETSFEHAIKESVAVTSKGNPEEDRIIERAIRASVAELQRASREGDDEDAVQRAIHASVLEAGQQEPQAGPGHQGADVDLASRDRLEALIRQSVGKNGASSRDILHGTSPKDDDSGIDTDDDENIQLALQESKKSLSNATTRTDDHDDELVRALEASISATKTTESTHEQELSNALQASQKAHSEHEEKLSQADKEEQIVLDYIKKQSLIEAELKAKADASGT